MRYFLSLSYKGTHYHGWQSQPNVITVQEVLDNALTTVLRSKIITLGAGRTDTGVHAKELIVHFDCNLKLDITTLVYKLNAYLPEDIAVSSITPVKKEAHARFDALARAYEYHVHFVKDPFKKEQSYLVKHALDFEKMNEACKLLFDYEDFQCFSKSKTDVKTYNCEIMGAHWKVTDSAAVFHIKANRFLRNMVRAIVGTLIEIGTAKITKDDLHDIIASKDRGNAGYSVPAQGLFLTEVVYPESIYLH